MEKAYIFALDFDGVICDSARETAASGWKAGMSIWPDLFKGSVSDEIVDNFCIIRPVLKTGYESLLLLRLLVEGHSPQEILADYSMLKSRLITDLHLDIDYLKVQFGEARDRWMETDLNSWLNANSAYPGTIEAVNSCKSAVYIITTKQKRFTGALVKHFGLNVSDDHIYGLESGPKADTLAKLLRKHENSSIIFIEDNIQSIENESITSLKRVRGIFAKWGYSTPENRDYAETAENVTPITLAEFTNLLSSAGKTLG